MAKMKHIAIATPEPEKTAQFYQEVMGLKIVARNDFGDTDAVFLSDGDISLALLHFKTDKAALCPEGAKFVGLHHVGFLTKDQAENDQVLRTLRELGAPAIEGGPLGVDGVYVEQKFTDPNGVTFDVSMGGWPGISR